VAGGKRKREQQSNDKPSLTAFNSKAAPTITVLEYGWQGQRRLKFLRRNA